MNIHHPAMGASAVIPFSLREAPAFIEAQFPVGRISAEAYKERKANLGQTLTALGSYWKGRKPLLLVRATVLGSLLPATQDPVTDLHVFLLLMGMDDASFARRIRSVKPADIDPDFPRYLDLVAPTAAGERSRWREGLEPDARAALVAEWLATLPYDERLSLCFRPEEVGEEVVDASAWVTVNAHLGTAASSLPELIEQLGIMRYGHRPVVADTFSGGGSIPFEAARMGCNVYASDLNPIACMLTWAAFNVLGASPETRAGIEAAQRRVADAVDERITALGVEHDAEGNRAKAFLYCLETVCPKTGWRVPMIPSLVISKTRKVIAKLVPMADEKRYRIDVLTGVSTKEMTAAEHGTVRDGRLVHPMNPDPDGVSLSIVRGDHRVGGERRNNLRLWEKDDFRPRLDDIFGERLYAVQWISKDTIGAGRQATFFAAATPADDVREATVEATVRENLTRWQERGWVPDMSILPGDKTDEPIRTRGWTHWHHLFTPRQLQLLAYVQEASEELDPIHRAVMSLIVARCADNSSKLTRWDSGVGQDRIANTFSNQALNTLYNYAGRAFPHLQAHIFPDFASIRMPGIDRFGVKSVRASEAVDPADIFVTDPPYADAVNYHEITEYFIAWLRKNPAPPFAGWTWDSRREFAIKGTDEKFRSDMVGAYRAMAGRMPDNGIQVVMFTHQNAGIWADLASIMWAAGLRVSAAWNIVTETESALKEGNYVQGTVLLVLRKRLGGGNVKRMDIEGEIEEAVDHQLAALHDLDEDWTSERLYTDGDLQLAAYAAALRVITGYATIDRKEVGADVYRKLAKGEKTVIRELIEYAASVANNKLVPDGFPPAMWRDLDPSSRFYVRMLDMESKGTTKFADYQDFARTFSVSDYADLMDSTRANAASLAGAAALRGKILGGKGFGSTPLRRVLFATFKTISKENPREGLAFLKTEFDTEKAEGQGDGYWANRMRLVALAKYVSAKTARTRPVESSAADLLAQRLEVDKV